MKYEEMKNKNLRMAAYFRNKRPDIHQEPSYQLKAAEYQSMAEANGWRFVGLYMDEGEPGAGREKMLEACRNGDIDILITRALRRIDSDLKVAIPIAHELRDLPKPVGVYFEMEELFSLDPECDDHFETLLKFQEGAIVVNGMTIYKLPNSELFPDITP